MCLVHFVFPSKVLKSKMCHDAFKILGASLLLAADPCLRLYNPQRIKVTPNIWPQLNAREQCNDVASQLYCPAEDRSTLVGYISV